MNRRFPVLAALLMTVATLGSAARGASISYSDSIPLQLTNFTDSVSIPLFDPSLGTLTSIDFELSGSIESGFQFESLDAAPATITGTIKADLTLERPDNSDLVVTIPTTMTLDDVTAFDGVLDFGGTSGKTYTGLTASDTESASSSSASDLALFTGVGNINLNVIGAGTSTATGAGNLATIFSTFASANVKVTYNFQPNVIPEPASLAMAGFGALALGLVGLRRRVRRDA